MYISFDFFFAKKWDSNNSNKRNLRKKGDMSCPVDAAMADWPLGASLSDAEVDALHLAHHEKPRDVLGCHRWRDEIFGWDEMG